MNGDLDRWAGDDDGDAADEIGDALPVVLATGDEIDAAEADALFERVISRLTPLEAEGLGNALRSVGKWAGSRQVRSLAGGLLPIAGTAVGTVYGGPMGAALGRALGERVGQVVGGGARTPAPAVAPAGAAPVAYAAMPPGAPAATPASPVGPALGAEPAPTVGDGSTAAAKLLYLVQNPAFLSSLASLVLGQQGAHSVTVGEGNVQVPVGAFVNAAASLVEKAAQDADELAGGPDEASDAYLRDDAGRLTVDPVVPDQRADALLRTLQEEDDWMGAGDAFAGEDGGIGDDEPWLG